MVTFDEENTNSVVPIILINGGRGDRKDGEKCEVMWPNDKKMYSGTVVALYIHYQLLLICNQQVTLCAGTEQEMNTILDDNGKGEDSDDGSSESSGTDECRLITRPFVSLGSVCMVKYLNMYAALIGSVNE